MREEFEGEFYPYGPVDSRLPHWSYLMQVTDTIPKTHKRILVPLDRSIKAAEGVLAVVQELLEPEGEAILLHVIPEPSTKMVGSGFVPSSRVEKEERARAMGYLKYFADRQNNGPGHWRCEVAVSVSVVDGITDTAAREEVDLIAMYTHDRKGLARLIKGSVTNKVKERASKEVRVIRPRELVSM